MVQYTTAQTFRKLLRRTLVKKSGPVPGPERVSGGQYTDSVHNRTRYVLGVWRSVHRFSTQPHKICLGVDIDGSVHNRTNLAKFTLVPEVSTPMSN